MSGDRDPKAECRTCRYWDRDQDRGGEGWCRYLSPAERDRPVRTTWNEWCGRHPKLVKEETR